MASSPELANLRDSHAPDPIGWWPLAPGWICLAVVLVIVIIVSILFLRRYYRNGCAKRNALRLLSAYQQDYQNSHHGQSASACVSELLKRVALVYFPRATVASLQGDAWITFLKDTSKGLAFDSLRRELLEMPYQPKMDGDLQLLFTMAHKWISQRRGSCLN